MKPKTSFDKRHFGEDVIKASRAIAGHPLRIAYLYQDDNDPPHDNDALLHLPETKSEWLTPTAFSKKGQTLVRAQGDGIALRKKFHDEAIHIRHRPHDELLGESYDALEETRLCLLGGRVMAGVHANLAQSLGELCHAMPQASLSLGLRLLLLKYGGRTHSDHDRLFAPHKNISAGIKPAQLNELIAHLDQQEEFATRALALLNAWKIEQKQPDEQGDDQNQDEEDFQNEEEEDISNNQEQEDVPSKDKQEQSPAVKREDKPHWIPISQEMDDPRPNDIEDIQEHLHLGGYAIYDSFHDKIATPLQLTPMNELERLRINLDEQVAPYRSFVMRLAKRLQRKLLAQHEARWEMDCDEGILNGARLARVIANPLYETPWKKEVRSSIKHTIVTLLIDNSGSMRGRPIAIAAMCADILAQTLERCGVKCEILGFTTRQWKGGRPREQWTQAGKPKDPGRLNELLHIIYKSADMPMRHGRKMLGLMLQEGLLKENIDGEALLWAASRLMRRSEERRILLVISDGAPVDDSTFSANYGNLLEDHLRAVVHHIEASPIELKAIGIGHDVSRYYSHAVTLLDASTLGETLLKEAELLFSQNIKR